MGLGRRSTLQVAECAKLAAHRLFSLPAQKARSLSYVCSPLANYKRKLSPNFQEGKGGGGGGEEGGGKGGGSCTYLQPVHRPDITSVVDWGFEIKYIAI